MVTFIQDFLGLQGFYKQDKDNAVSSLSQFKARHFQGYNWVTIYHNRHGGKGMGAVHNSWSANWYRLWVSSVSRNQIKKCM